MILERLKVIQNYQVVVVIIVGVLWLIFRPGFGLSIGIGGFFWFLLSILNTCEDDSNAQNNNATNVSV